MESIAWGLTLLCAICITGIVTAVLLPILAGIVLGIKVPIGYAFGTGVRLCVYQFVAAFGLMHVFAWGLGRPEGAAVFSLPLAFLVTAVVFSDRLSVSFTDGLKLAMPWSIIGIAALFTQITLNSWAISVQHPPDSMRPPASINIQNNADDPAIEMRRVSSAQTFRCQQ